MNKILKILQNYFFLQPSGTPEGLLERRRALAALVLFVGRRYYLRPIIRPWNSWNSRRLLELLERRIAVTRVCVCDGNAMNVRWTCDAFLNCAAKVLLFSDMAMGCPGCREVCVRWLVISVGATHLRKRSLSARTSNSLVFLPMYDPFKGLFVVPRGKSFGFSLIFLWQICLN